MARFNLLFIAVLLQIATSTLALTLRRAPLATSQFGLCGPLVQRTCTGSKFGASCSWFDVCGPQKNPIFSGKGCQPKYGTCGSPTSPTTPTNAGGTPIPTVHNSGPTAALPAGTPVSIVNPSFEQRSGTAKRSSIHNRQTASQVSSSATGWTILSCVGGTSGCQFENYDAFDGIWAFTAPNGGTIYQNNVLLTIGASYVFTFYWKTVVPSGASTISGVFLGTNPDISNTYTVGTPAFGQPPNQNWAEASISMGQLTCDTANSYGHNNGDGTATFIMFIDGRACPPSSPCYNAANPNPSFTWYLDEIRVQQTAAAAAGTTCPP